MLTGIPLCYKNMKMEAIILDERDQLHVESVLTPIPKANELLIRIVASGFNPIDYQMRGNKQERKRLHSRILGREFSGVVVKIGKEVNDFKPGDAVFCGSGSMGSNGTYAEYIAVPDSIVAVKPGSLSFQQAAALPSVGLTALQCLNRMKLRPADTVLITGAAGGVGAMFIKMLLAKQFQNFVVTAGNTESIASLIEIGVKEHQIINYHQADIENEAYARNGDQPFDYVVDMVGNRMSEFAGKVIKTNGTYVDVTALTTSAARELLFNKGAVILNISNYVYSLDQDYAYYKNGLQELVRLIEHTSVTPPTVLVLGSLSVTTVESAHEMLRENQSKGKKLIMQVSNLEE
jgi:alcohol dehydrogenase